MRIGSSGMQSRAIRTSGANQWRKECSGMPHPDTAGVIKQFNDAFVERDPDRGCRIGAVLFVVGFEAAHKGGVKGKEPRS